MGEPKSDRCGSFTSAGWKAPDGASEARTCRATGEALLVPARNRRSRVDRITGSTGKSIEGERVTDGLVVALRRGNARGARRSPAVCKVSDHKEGKDEMTKASIDLQDLRRRI